MQDAWVGVLKGLDGFEGRSSLRTWIFRILVNTAKTRGQRESRSSRSPRSGRPTRTRALGRPDRFLAADTTASPRGLGRAPVGGRRRPRSGCSRTRPSPEVGEAIETLPPNQREVIRLRDVLGWSSAEVCNALDITETNQRVLLHRARAKVRRALEGYLADRRREHEFTE